VTSFRSIIKKAVQEAVPLGYALYAPPSAVSREVRTKFLKDRATQLLKDSEYLLGDANEQVSEFISPDIPVVHPASAGKEDALRSSSTQASLSSCILLKHEQIPSNLPRISIFCP
jgi:hypothetical protein